MIIYGWRSSHLKTAQSNSISCPNCGEKGGIISSVYGRYVHIFWIPMIPLGKTGGSQCSKCNRSFKPKEMTEDLKRDYKSIKSEASMPVWHLSGMIIIALIVGFVMTTGKVDAKNELEYISNPMAGDVYEYEADVKNYTTLKVIEVKEDSIYFLNNNYALTKKIGIGKIDVDSCYNPEVYSMSKVQLKKLYDLGTIYDVNRK